MITFAPARRMDVIDDLTRRRFIGGGLSLAALLTACGGESGSAPPPGTSAGGSGFPVTVEHRYGSTTIPAEPQRVVTVGLSDPDFVLALGVKPVAITDWYGDYPLGIWPWAQEALDDARPGVIPRPEGDKINFELLAGYRPDLIIGQYTGMTKEEYERASQLAPTVAQSGEHKDYLMPWQVTTRTVGKALGRSAQAEKLIAGLESRFAAVRRERPEFEDATMMALLDTASVVIWKLFVDDDDFGAQQGKVPEELASHPLYPSLKVAREGRDVFLTDTVLLGSVIFGSPLSLPYALDRIVPMLAAALDGDPATEPTS